MGYQRRVNGDTFIATTSFHPFGELVNTIQQLINMFFRLCLFVVIVAVATAASIADGQTGCLFDGRVYQPGDVIMIGHCLARMTCLGNNNYGAMEQLGGQCPTPTQPSTDTTGIW